jgi:TPP-dependent indolepyruvate ferredoxin oxidoreductase alpha subunit
MGRKCLFVNLDQVGLADGRGNAEIPVLVMNVAYPVVPEQVVGFCAGKRAVLLAEEGQPEYLEQEIALHLRRADVQTRLHGKDLLPSGGEYTVEVLARGLLAYADQHLPGAVSAEGRQWLADITRRREAAAAMLAEPLPARPPTFCVGCPERPVFSALKLAQQQVGDLHVAADIGCHAIHHLSSKIPNYRLRACHARNAHLLSGVRRLSLADIPGCFSYILWDPQACRLTTIEALRSAAPVPVAS